MKAIGNSNKGAFKLTTKDVVATGIGAALYAVTSMIAISLGPNTSLRLAVALLSIFGSIFGPMVGFLVGFIGHALNDAMTSGNIWWSWVLMSGSIGFFSGFITLSSGFDVLNGKIKKVHIVLMYIYAVCGAIAGSILSVMGDVFIYGEPAEKVWLQIVIANITNLIVAAAVGIPVVIRLTKLKGETCDLEEED